MMVPCEPIELLEMKMLAACVFHVSLTSMPNFARKALALVRVSAIKGCVNPPLSSWLAYCEYQLESLLKKFYFHTSSGSVMFVSW